MIMTDKILRFKKFYLFRNFLGSKLYRDQISTGQLKSLYQMHIRMILFTVYSSMIGLTFTVKFELLITNLLFLNLDHLVKRSSLI